MTDAARDLRATSDGLLRDLEALAILETEKRETALDDPRLVDIARQVQEIASRVLEASAQQAELSETTVGSGSRETIGTTPRAVGEILAEWREIERRLGDAAQGSAEATELRILAERLREEYRIAFDQARRR